VPFYAKEYIGTGTANHGLYQSFDNTGLDINSLQWDQTPTPTFHNLVDDAGLLDNSGHKTAAATGWQLNTSWATFEPWLFNPAATHQLASGAVTTPTFISYDDPSSIGDRATLVRALGLRGAFAWEISQDSNAHSLISKLTPLLGH
jgi:chitinase